MVTGHRTLIIRALGPSLALAAALVAMRLASAATVAEPAVEVHAGGAVRRSSPPRDEIDELQSAHVSTPPMPWTTRG